MFEAPQADRAGALSIKGVVTCSACGARLINPRLMGTGHVQCIACRTWLQVSVRQELITHDADPTDSRTDEPAANAPTVPEPVSPNYSILISFAAMCGLALLSCSLPYVPMLLEGKMRLSDIQEHVLLAVIVLLPVLTGVAVLTAAISIGRLDRLATRLAWRSGKPLAATPHEPRFFLFSLAPICVVGSVLAVIGMAGIHDYWGLDGTVVAGLGLLTATYGLALEELHRFLRRLGGLLRVETKAPLRDIDYSPTFSFFILLPALASGAGVLLMGLPRSPDRWFPVSSCAYICVLCWGLFVLSRRIGLIVTGLRAVPVSPCWRLYRQLPWYVAGLTLICVMVFGAHTDAIFLLLFASANIWLSGAVLAVRQLLGGLRCWAIDRTAVFVDRRRTWQERLAGAMLLLTSLAILSAVFVKPGLPLPLLAFSLAWWCLGAGLVAAELSKTCVVVEAANGVAYIQCPTDTPAMPSGPPAC